MNALIILKNPGEDPHRPDRKEFDSRRDWQRILVRNRVRFMENITIPVIQKLESIGLEMDTRPVIFCMIHAEGSEDQLKKAEDVEGVKEILRLA